MAMLGVTFAKQKMLERARENREAASQSGVVVEPTSTQKLVRKILRKKNDYVPSALQSCIYDEKTNSGVTKSMLLSFDELISMEPGYDKDDENSKHPGRHLFRFTTDNRARAVDMFEMLVAAASLLVFPLTFLYGGSWSDPEWIPGKTGMLVLDLLLDLLYLVTLVLDFNMSYMHRRKNYEVLDRKRIVKHIMSNPFFWVSAFSTTCPIWTGLGANTLVNNIKLVRVRHVLELPDSLWFYRDRRWARLARPIVLLIGASHWMACLLGYFGGYRDALITNGAAEYATTFQDFEVGGAFSMYLTALVEGVFLLTGGLDNPVGDGSVREKQFGALLMVCIFGPIGCVVASLLTATLANEVGMAYALQARHEENKAFMSHALRILNIPKPLRQRVFSQFYFQKMGHDVEAFDALFNKKNLSLPLENALLVYLHQETVIPSSILKDRDPNYVIEVLRVLQFRVFLPGDYVARRGEIAFTMYFVSKGGLSLLIPSQDPDKAVDVKYSKRVAGFTIGQSFGEITLIKNCTRTAWVRSDEYSVLSALDRDKIEPVWFHFPEERDRIVALVQEHGKKDQKRAVQNRWKKGVAKAKYLVHTLGEQGFDAAGHHDHNHSSDSDDDAPSVAKHATEKAIYSSSSDEAELAEAAGNEPGVSGRTSSVGKPRTSGLGKPGKGGRFQTVDTQNIQGQIREILERQVALESMVRRALRAQDGTSSARVSTLQAPGQPSSPPSASDAALAQVQLEIPDTGIPKTNSSSALPQKPKAMKDRKKTQATGSGNMGKRQHRSKGSTVEPGSGGTSPGGSPATGPTAALQQVVPGTSLGSLAEDRPSGNQG